MSRLTHINAPDGVFPATQYTHVVMGTGRFVAIAGQLPLDKEGQLVGEGDPAAQARQVFDNLRHCLVAAGGSFRDVVKLTYYVTDMAYMPAVRAARDTHMDPARLPAASAVQVSALVSPQFLMEIEAYAIL
ncbi:RidA family protein [Streptomyces sp. BA2]|uniref:RidA family protein n=1 Tax=Streptomyces sp. BA2 TaxID=436595 RepID=UPI00132567E1|nr:RidA family protein [Streptomyces sp. BA2]MWA14710.1 RidA family protein [Streptomyces sp. BA2]